MELVIHWDIHKLECKVIRSAFYGSLAHRRETIELGKNEVFELGH